MSTIVHLFGSLDPGGAELRTLELVRSSRPADQQHIFVTLSGRAGSLAAEFETAGCEVVVRGLSSTFPFWFIRFLRRRGATHLHSHVHLASGYFLALALVARVERRIAHLRSFADGKPDSLPRRLHRHAGRSLISMCATDTIAVSESVLTGVLGYTTQGGRASRVIYDQVDGSRFPLARPASASQIRILIVGRLDADKNPLRALDVIAALVRRDPGMDLVARFVGRATTEQTKSLDQRTSDLGIEANIAVLGERDDVPDLLAASDLLVSTTLREGLPGAVIESSAAGIPSVVSAIAPNEEVGRLLPSVVTVPLAAEDDVWADVILDVLAQRRDRLLPVTVRAWFDASPFALQDQKELDRVWS